MRNPYNLNLPTDQMTEDEIRKARAQAARLAYIERNRDWMEEQKRLKSLTKRKKRRKRKPKVDLKALAAAKEEAERLKAAQVEAARLETEAWNEMGWIVAKMNIKAKLSQEQIFDLLGGLYTKKQIKNWCATGKKMNRLRPVKDLRRTNA